MTYALYILGRSLPTPSEQAVMKALATDGVGTTSVLAATGRSIAIGKKPRQHWKAKRSERKYF